MQKQRVSMHGDEIAFFQDGSGPVLLLIHGMAGSSNTWEAVIPELAKHFTVVAPDLIGHGDSAKAKADYSLGGYATGLRDLMLRLGHERFTIVGQSFGGGVALQFTHQFPEMCERLVLVGSGGLGPEVNAILKVLSVPGAGWLLVAGCRAAFHRAARRVGRWLGKLGVRSSPVMEEISRSYGSLTDPATRRSFLHTLRSVIDSRGQRVSASAFLYLGADVPSLIVWGDADPIIPVAHAHAAREHLPHAQLEIFPGVGHFPHCEAPERFARVVLDFVASTPARPTTLGRRRELILAAS